MKDHLLRIANTLILYQSHANNQGLIRGKMGIALFYYHYARYMKNEFYNDLADELFDEILAEISRVPYDFENGLIGIGWAIDYLIKNEFIEGDSDDVLHDIDKRILSQIKVDFRYSLLGQGIYLFSRLSTSKTKTSELTTYSDVLLEQCYEQLKKIDKAMSLYFLNSLLYFLLSIDRKGIINERILEMKKLISGIAANTLKEELYNDVDLLIFNRLLNRIDIGKNNEWQKILQLKRDISFEKNSVEDFIKNTFQSTLYFERESLNLPFVSHVLGKINK